MERKGDFFSISVERSKRRAVVSGKRKVFERRGDSRKTGSC